MYLSYLSIENYRGIESLEVDFDPNINIIIGENGCNKSAVIDAIRLLYNLGEPIRDLSVSLSDFHEKAYKDGDSIKIETSKQITITYHFKGLTNAQKGAFYEYMVIDPGNSENDYAKIRLVTKIETENIPNLHTALGMLKARERTTKPLNCSSTITWEH